MNMAKEEALTEERWQAIIGNDASYDFKFFYAVKSTGIFCRPSCKSKVPNRANVRIFRTAAEAIREEFRPCKRCKPTGERLPDREWVEAIARYMERHYDSAMTLNMLAEMFHGSPYHLHRTFKKIMKATPVAYLQGIRLDKAREQLARTNMSVAEVGSSVGLPSPSYFISLFKRTFGMTPYEYRKRMMETEIWTQGGAFDEK